jgi:plastocyanin
MIRIVSVIITLLAFALTASAGEIAGKVSGVNGKSVVYLNAPAGKAFEAPAEHPVINQQSLSFQPRILVVQQGTTIDFVNGDSVQHNVFWPSVGGDRKAGHNMGTWPTGQKRSFKFDKPGVVSLLCNVHPEMAGYIVVSPTPYFAETDENGEFHIAGVPDGTYTATIWHEGAKPQTKSITVSSATKADFSFGK